ALAHRADALEPRLRRLAEDMTLGAQLGFARLVLRIEALAPQARQLLARHAHDRLAIGFGKLVPLALVDGDEEARVVEAAGDDGVMLELVLDAEVDDRLDRVQGRIDHAALEQLVSLRTRAGDRNRAEV